MRQPNSFLDSPFMQTVLLNSTLLGCVHFLDTLSPAEFCKACYHEGAEEGARVRSVLRSHLGHLYDVAAVDLWICGNEVWCSLVKELPKISRENTARLRRWIYLKVDGGLR